jgi:hypothetical protein
MLISSYDENVQIWQNGFIIVQRRLMPAVLR